ncbi:MAG: protein kinase domain-containing protein [Gemmatimonadales bacterium]
MADLRNELTAALADRYGIERELGRGGMATVFLARDLRHDRPVAFKVLHPDLAATLGPERFQREIRMAARLQHPHILTVLDSGEAGGRLWFTMPFIQGESLRDRLNREKQLPVEDALRIAREAADALDYAHQEGIVHRDIKPENIMLTGRHALVADFGIARALGGSVAQRLTETGLAIGTPAYMSPEQGTGEREVDGRSDIYSLGIVLYEMLAGEPPFGGATAQAMIARRFTETARPLRTVRETVPEMVEQAVAKALAKAPADRFVTAGEFAKALEEGPQPSRQAMPATATATLPSGTIAKVPTAVAGRPRFRSAAILALGFVLGLGVLFGWLRKHNAADAARDTGPKLLAVVPFENLGAPQDEYFADGVTDEIRGKLASLPGLQVTARSSSGQYKRTSKTPQEIGRELGVDYLLTGTVRWEKGSAGNRVRVSPELIQVSTGSSRWQQPFDAALSDVFQVQADVAGRVAEALNLAMEAPTQRELAARPTSSLAAYDAFLKGEDAAQGIWGTSPGQLRHAATLYEQAVALDSTFVAAWAQLSRVLSYANYVGTPTVPDAERARVAADRAVALGPGRAEGRLARGDYHRNITYDNEHAREEYAEGLRIAPNDPDLLTGAALAEQSLGRWDEAVAQLRRALALDPRSITTARRLGFTLLWMRRYPEALTATDRALALAPAHLQTRSTKAMMFLAQGDLAHAREVVRPTPEDADPTALVSYIATYWDLYWLLDDQQQALLLRLTPSAFDGDRGTWGEVMAETYALHGDSVRMRAYADSSRQAFQSQLHEAPNDPQRHVLLGVALAYLGRRAEAIREGERGVALLPVSRDGYSGPYNQHQLARIYILLGEQEKALDQLEPLLKIPYYLSPGWLKVDPTFDPLRKNPRFQKLIAGTS